DTERIYTLATQNVVSRYGKTFTPDIKARVMGTRSDESARIIVSALELPVTPEAYLDELLGQLEILLPTTKLMPGAARLLKHLSTSKIPMALATSSRSEPYKLKTRNHATTFALFDAKVNGDNPNVKNGKPAPDTFLVAADEIGADDYGRCLVFEDSIVGVRAAVAASMPVVWVRDLTVSSMDVPEDHGATLVLTTLEEFEPEQFGLPPYADE
ncbi:HAD-like protein, partial [Ramicandelaber brevisporus]